MKSERLILGLIFILLLFLLCSNYAYEGYYQDNSVIDLLHSYSESQVLIHGPVIDTYNDGVKVYNINNHEVINVKTKLKLNLGTDLYVLGILDPKNELIADKIMIFKMSSVFNIILRSLFGFILFLIFFGKYWKFNFKKMEFFRSKKSSISEPKNKKFLRRK